MAAESSEPRSGIILQLGFVAIVSLLGAHYGLVSYFNTQMDGAYQLKVASHTKTDVNAFHEREKQALAAAPVPIDRAIALMASRPRINAGDGIMPQPSNDTSALAGWSLLPHDLTAAESGDGGAIAEASDAGAAAIGDGGAQTAATDAGAKPGAPNAAAADAGRPNLQVPAPAPSAAPKKTP